VRVKRFIAIIICAIFHNQVVFIVFLITFFKVIFVLEDFRAKISELKEFMQKNKLQENIKQLKDVSSYKSENIIKIMIIFIHSFARKNFFSYLKIKIQANSHMYVAEIKIV
jgi:hypothetical protein